MEKEQFDEYLGGSIKLPQDVQIVKLAAARANEIAAMSYSIENPQQSKLVFQKLPVHMRRRVMSHNAKRMPRRLREAHLRQMTKSGLPPKSKRPSRKYRRRPKNLLKEYNRRQRKDVWLETHIWHAKRFHMIKKWGFKIANHPNDKSYRACYRAAAKHCMIQDISYYYCIEIVGPGDTLKENLKKHCNPGELSFAAKIYFHGNREGNLMFYKKNSYPNDPIGNVKFMWKPGEEKFKTIWIWIHPIVYKSFFDEIVDSFEFKKEEEMDNICQRKNLKFSNEKFCSMTNLQNSLNRFRLTGPLAIAILSDVLHVPDMDTKTVSEYKNKSSNGREIDEEISMEVDYTSTTNDWHEDYYKISENLEAFKVQRETMEILRTLKSPNQLPPKSVLAVTVLDPRFFLPPKRTKKLLTEDYYTKISIFSNLAAHSPIWDSKIRENVRINCKSINDINKLRSECLIPGIGNDDLFDEKIISKIPLILIQNPGCNGEQKSIGFISGIDVIIPAGWSMPFWQACIFRCARAGGLRESRSMALERLDLNSPETDQPDIAAYDNEAILTMSNLREKYFRYPPNRRVNYTKFGITSPFYCEWKILMKEWTSSEKFRVLRDGNLLESLEKALSMRNNRRGKNKNINGRKIDVRSSEEIFDMETLTDRNFLIPIKISVEGKGRPKNYAIICMPTQDDLEIRNSKNKWSGPVQKFLRDPNESERKILRKNQKVMLKRSNRRNRRCKKLIDDTAEILKLEKRFGNLSKFKVDKNYEMKKNYCDKMKELYLPKCKNVRKSCDRDVMGYVTQGDFSFSEARGVGIGYVVLDSLINLINAKSNIVLVRNTQTRQYRIAKIEVLNQYR